MSRQFVRPSHRAYRGWCARHTQTRIVSWWVRRSTHSDVAAGLRGRGDLPRDPLRARTQQAFAGPGMDRFWGTRGGARVGLANRLGMLCRRRPYAPHCCAQDRLGAVRSDDLIAWCYVADRHAACHAADSRRRRPLTPSRPQICAASIQRPKCAGYHFAAAGHKRRHRTLCRARGIRADARTRPPARYRGWRAEVLGTR